MRDLVALFFLISTLGIYSAYGLYINYHIAYIKADHADYSKQLIYTTVVFLDFGLVAANYFVLKLITKYGLRRALQFGGNLSMFTSIAAIFVTNLYGVYLIYFLFGCVHQVFTFCTMFYLGLKYEKSLVRLSGYVFTGSSLAYLVWAYGASVIMNPDNCKESKLIESGDLAEYVFPDEVMGRFPIFCGVNGLITLLASFVVSWMLQVEGDLFSEASLALSANPSELDFTPDEQRQILLNLKMNTQILVLLKNSVHDQDMVNKSLRRSGRIKRDLRRIYSRSQDLTKEGQGQLARVSGKNRPSRFGGQRIELSFKGKIFRENLKTRDQGAIKEKPPAPESRRGDDSRS